MQRRELNELKWLEFDLLTDIPLLRHGVFLRSSGCSQGPYSSLNVGLNVGDISAHVIKNRHSIQMHFQKNLSKNIRLVCSHNEHANNVALVQHTSPNEFLHCDGLITNTPNIALMMQHADCQIALIYDPINHAIANVHSGWRSSVLNIYAKAVQQMQKIFGSRPEDLLVCISPSLGPDEAEFINYRTELPEAFWSFQVRPNYFDFWSISEQQFKLAGVLTNHIEIARISTFKHPDDFFSYRRDKITGRHATCTLLL